jgi:hypothetical protein
LLEKPHEQNPRIRTHPPAQLQLNSANQAMHSTLLLWNCICHLRHVYIGQSNN